MTIFQGAEQSQRNPVVNVIHGPLAATLANPTAALHHGEPSRFPPNTVGSWRAALPSWMGFAALKFRLPFRHARVVAKRQDGMEIGGCPRHALSAPITSLGYAVRPPRVRFPHFTLLAAFKRTVFLIALASACAWLPAYPARWAGHRRSPSVSQIASRRAVLTFWPSVERVIVRPAPLALARNARVSHAIIIPPIEIEERYCEIAAKRLAQEVLDFGPAPEPEGVQEELFGGDA